MTTMIGIVDGLSLIGWSWWDEDLGLLWSRNYLLSRGWRKKQIDALGEPDAYGKNPHGGYYVHLYRSDRIREVERTW